MYIIFHIHLMILLSSIIFIANSKHNKKKYAYTLYLIIFSSFHSIPVPGIFGII